MPALLRGLLASPLAERHDLTTIFTHRPGGAYARTAAFVRALVALARWGLRNPSGVVHVHFTVRGNIHRKTLVVAAGVDAGPTRGAPRPRRRDRAEHLPCPPRAATPRHFSVGLSPRGARARRVERQRHILETLYGAPAVEVLPNTVEPVAPAAASSAAAGAPTILFLGGFANPGKGGTVLLEALPAVRLLCPRARIDPAGPGEPPVGLRPTGSTDALYREVAPPTSQAARKPGRARWPLDAVDSCWSGRPEAMLLQLPGARACL